jgi:hypothetical protein
MLVNLLKIRDRKRLVALQSRGMPKLCDDINWYCQVVIDKAMWPCDWEGIIQIGEGCMVLAFLQI